MKRISKLLFVLLSVISFGQVGINTTIPHNSSDLELGADNKALLLNRVSSPSDIETAVEGMMIFDTEEHCFKGYQNATWVNITDCTNVVERNVQDIYGGINAQTLQQAIDDAIVYCNNNPNESISLELNSGTYYLNEQIEVTGMNETGTGWLYIQGAEDGSTELIDTEYDSDTDNTFEFDEIYRVKMKNLKIIGEKITASQGTIVAINTFTNSSNDGTFLDIDIDDGYPNIDQLYEIETTKANKIRVFDDTGADGIPHFIEGPNNDHYYYRWAFEGDINGNGVSNDIRPVLIDATEDIWRFRLREQDIVNNNGNIPFEVGQRVGISSKSNRSEWARFKNGGADFVAENLTFLRLGRCKFRGGNWENILFKNVKIIRPTVNGKVSFYSTDAGPQFGHDSEEFNIENLRVENCDFRGTIDDGSAFQKVQSGYAKNNHWEDGGGVLVGPNTSSNFIFENNVHFHCPLEDER